MCSTSSAFGKGQLNHMRFQLAPRDLAKYREFDSQYGSGCGATGMMTMLVGEQTVTALKWFECIKVKLMHSISQQVQHQIRKEGKPFPTFTRSHV